ncbi:tyrosine-type recombinase/integrase [Streptomyces sp. NPDC086091]|uniref:tyrosine-type recombinase/integrase n=1 Tax=Streptomyces sp. NPDC086091 TaxID=3365751 RepID=UPI0037F70A8D
MQCSRQAFLPSLIRQPHASWYLADVRYHFWRSLEIHIGLTLERHPLRAIPGLRILLSQKPIGSERTAICEFLRNQRPNSAQNNTNEGRDRPRGQRSGWRRVRGTRAGLCARVRTGAALNHRQLRVRAYKIMDENGLRRVRLYDARASCLTYLANNGVPDHLLAMWAGHTNVKTTKKWYVKPDVADLLPAAEAWGGLAGGV